MHRTAHKKSRTGCKRCKSRKVKCDEETPTCSACRRHKTLCEYPDASQFGRPAPLAADGRRDPSAFLALGGLDARLGESGERRLLELELLHHYLTVVAQTIHEEDSDPLLKEVWTVKVPGLAFRHPFLLHAIMSTAALHLVTEGVGAKEMKTTSKSSPSSFMYSQRSPASPMPSYQASPSDGSSPRATSSGSSVAHATGVYAKARPIYFDLALKELRHVISCIQPENADAACMTTLLISNQGFLATRGPENEAYEPPVQWLQLASTSPVVIRTALPMLLPDSAIRTLIAGSNQTAHRPRTTLRDENRERFSSLLDWVRFPEPELDETIRLAYERTLNFAGSIYLGIEAGEPSSTLCRRFLEFALYVPREFSQLVERRRPRALAILAHVFAMTKKVNRIWWFRGAAERHVHGIGSILPSEWQWALVWPHEVLASSPAA